MYIAALAALLLVAYCVINAEKAKTEICKAMGGEYHRESEACLSMAVPEDVQ